MIAGAKRGLRRFVVDRRGSAALIVAICMPMLALLVAGGVELSLVTLDKNKTQDIADSAALLGAKEMTLAPKGADERTKAFANSALTAIARRSTVTVTVTPVDQATIKVAIDTHRMSFFGNILPPGGFFTHSEATASSVRRAPLCVITISAANNDDLVLKDTAKMTASCLVHSDQKLTVAGGASLTGAQVEAVTSSTGVTTPAAQIGAAPVGDPFTSVNVTPPSGCLGLGGIANLDLIISTPLLPGVHCFKYSVKNGSTLTLQPGVHYFYGDLSLKNKASLVGDNVTLVFTQGTKLDTKDGSNVALTGSRSGGLAGFVLATTRDYTGDFHIDSDPFTKVTGAIYAPNAKLVVEGSTKAAASSDWTVIAAKAVELNHSPNLVINADYSISAVPVPNGVGKGSTKTRLTK